MEDNKHNPPQKNTTENQTISFPVIAETTDEEKEQIQKLLDGTFSQNLTPSDDSNDKIENCNTEQTTSTKNKAGFKPLPMIPNFVGLIPQTKLQYQDSPLKRFLFGACITLLLAIILLISLTIITAIYAGVILSALLLSLVIICICIGLIAIGIGGLVYGIVLIFTHGILTGLFEVGLCLILFSVILALTALASELSTGQLPRFIRYLTRLFLYLFVYLLSYVFGASKFRPDNRKEVLGA